MTIADQPFRAIFDSIGLLFVGFMAIARNRGGAKGILFMINEAIRVLLPKTVGCISSNNLQRLQAFFWTILIINFIPRRFHIALCNIQLTRG